MQLNLNKLKKDRSKICNKCEHKKLNICTQCGCFIPAKVMMPFAGCPLKKWASPPDMSEGELNSYKQ